MALDGDAALTFQVHVVQHLSVGHLNGIGEFQQAVGKGGFSVVNMGNNAKVTYILHLSILRFLVIRVQIYTKIFAFHVFCVGIYQKKADEPTRKSPNPLFFYPDNRVSQPGRVAGRMLHIQRRPASAAFTVAFSCIR